MTTFVVAEMGSSWLFGQTPKTMLKHGLKLLLIAHNCGANAVKVQWVSDPRALAHRRHFRGDRYRHLRWPIEWHGVLAGAAHDLGMQYISTVFLPQDVPLLAPFVDRFKVASLEADDMELCRTASGAKIPCIVSTGCMAEGDARRLLPRTGWKWTSVQILHCVAAYPAAIGELNLRCLRLFDGFSDHSRHVLAGAFAVCAGASTIEVHCRLDETPKDNSDYGHSHAPESLRQYIANIRLAETMLGDGRKQIMPSEQPLMKHRV